MGLKRSRKKANKMCWQRLGSTNPCTCPIDKGSNGQRGKRLFQSTTVQWLKAFVWICFQSLYVCSGLGEKPDITQQSIQKNHQHRHSSQGESIERVTLNSPEAESGLQAAIFLTDISKTYLCAEFEWSQNTILRNQVAQLFVFQTGLWVAGNTQVHFLAQCPSQWRTHQSQALLAPTVCNGKIVVAFKFDQLFQT